MGEVAAVLVGNLSLQRSDNYLVSCIARILPDLLTEFLKLDRMIIH